MCVGEAKTVLGDWQPAAVNYARAWSSLNAKFNDTYRIKLALLSKWNYLKSAERESYAVLRSIIDTVTNVMRQVEAVGINTDNWDFLVMSRLMVWLPRYTIDAWEQRRDVSVEPTLQSMLDFLEARARGCSHKESSRPDEPMRHKDHGGHVHSGKRRDQSDHGGEGHRNSANTYGGPRRSGEAPVSELKAKQIAANNPCREKCSDQHPLYGCPNFQRRSVTEREKMLKDWSICAQCLLPIHGDCNLKCFRCKGPHNSIICQAKREFSSRAHLARGSYPKKSRKTSHDT